jgi:sigma-B regulation protein RsbU (phosphoserine phosphatase)
MANTLEEPKPMRIIVVDDDAMSRRLLSRALEHEYEVVECHDGFEVARLLESGGPALLVLDYQMPEINGAEVCRLIRASADPEVAQTPIIMLTGHSQADHEVECLQSGADDFVTKPVNLAVLRARIETHARLNAMRRLLLEQKGELEKWRRRHEEDLEAARRTQQAILPARMPVLAGWNFGAHYHPFIQIGGDIYDWIKAPDGSLVVWMSDATGHGAAAALLTTLSKLLFRHAAAETWNAAGLMDCVEREFQAVFKGHSYMTAACMVLSPGRGRVSFCGAGQPPLLVARRSGEVESIRATRPPLGLNKAAASEEAHCELRHGEALLLYTDGLYEVRNAGGARLGHEELNELVRLLPRPAGASAQEWLRGIIEKAGAFAASVPFPDDIAAFTAIYG